MSVISACSVALAHQRAPVQQAWVFLPVGSRIRLQRFEGAGARNTCVAKAANSNQNQAASEAFENFLQSDLDDPEHVPPASAASHHTQDDPYSRARGGIATSGSGVATLSHSSVQEASGAAAEQIKSLLGDYEHVTPVSHSSSLLSQPDPDAFRDQCTSVQQGLQLGDADATSVRKHPRSEQLAGCVGQFSRIQVGAVTCICFATFRQPVQPAESARAASESHVVRGHASASGCDGANMGALHDLCKVKAAAEEVLQMHADIFSGGGTGQEHSQHLPLLRQAIIDLGVGDFMMPLIHATVDMAQWNERYLLHSEGVIRNRNSHLGHTFPIAWTWNQGVDAVQHCIVHFPTQFWNRGFSVLGWRNSLAGLNAITDNDALLIKTFLSSVKMHQTGTFDILCTRTAMEDPATMAVCQKVAKDVLAIAILDKMFLNSDDETQLEKAIVALHAYCGYRVCGDGKAFFRDLLYPTMRCQHSSHGRVFVDSYPHVSAALNAVLSLTATQMPVSKRQRYLPNFTIKLISRIRQPLVMYKVACAPNLLASMGVGQLAALIGNMAAIGQDMFVAGPGEDSRSKDRLFRELAAHVQHTVNKECRRSVPGSIVSCLAGLSALGHTSVELAAQVQNAFARTLYSKQQTEKTMNSTMELLLQCLLDFEYPRTPYLVTAMNVYLATRHKYCAGGTARLTRNRAQQSLRMMCLLLKCRNLQNRTFNTVLEAVLSRDVGLSFDDMCNVVQLADEQHLKLEPRVANRLVDACRQQPESLALPRQAKLLYVLGRQRIIHVPLAQLALRNLDDETTEFNSESTEVNSDLRHSSQLVAHAVVMTGEAPHRAEARRAMTPVSVSKGLQQAILLSSGGTKGPAMQTLEDPAANLSSDDETVTFAMDADLCARDPQAPSETHTATLRTWSTDSGIGGTGGVLGAPGETDNELTMQLHESLIVHGDPASSNCESHQSTLLDLIPRCEALEGVAAMFYEAFRGPEGSPIAAQKFAESAAISPRWLLQIISELCWRFRAVREHENPLYLGMLAMALHALGRIAYVFDVAVMLDAERKLSKECRRACEKLVEEIHQCLAAEVARLQAEVPAHNGSVPSPVNRPGSNGLASMRAGPAPHVILAVKAMEWLCLSEERITRILRSTVPLVHTSQRPTTVGSFLRFYYKYGIQNYAPHDHYFSIVVDQVRQQDGKQPLPLMILKTTGHALRTQYMPGKEARKVIADLALSAVNSGHPEVLKLYVDLLGIGLPLDERLISPLAASLEGNMTELTPYQILVAWHAFAYRKSVQPEFEASALIILDAYFEHNHRASDIHVMGKAKHVQQVWRHHGRALQYPLAVQHAVDSVGQDSTISSFQKQVFQTVKAIAPDAQLEYDDHECTIDIAIVRPDSTKIAIECDGAMHFWLNTHPYELNLQSELRNAMLCKRGWFVVCIPQHDWFVATSHPDRSESEKLRLDYVKHALQHSGC